MALYDMQGIWFARSPAVVHSRLMETLVWMRVPGDIVFAIGELFLALFAVRPLVGGTRKQPKWFRFRNRARPDISLCEASRRPKSTNYYKQFLMIDT